MSLLDQLWDDTVAGPPPESGLGKLRKQPSFTPPSRSGKESDGGGSSEGLKVSRRIMIVKPPITQSGSPPVSPAGSTPPVSPFAERQCLGVRKSLRLLGSPNSRSKTKLFQYFIKLLRFMDDLSGGGEAYRLFRRRSLSDAYEKPSGIRPGSPRPPYNV